MDKRRLVDASGHLLLVALPKPTSGTFIQEGIVTLARTGYLPSRTRTEAWSLQGCFSGLGGGGSSSHELSPS